MLGRFSRVLASLYWPWVLACLFVVFLCTLKRTVLVCLVVAAILVLGGMRSRLPSLRVTHGYNSGALCMDFSLS